MIVALSAVESQAEEGARDSAGEAYRIGLVRVVRLDGHANKVRLGLVGPQPLRGDQIADHLIVRTIIGELLRQPGDEATASVQNEGAILGADEGAGEALGEVIGEAAILQDVVDPPRQALSFRQELELADFLQRGDGTHQTKGETASNSQVRR